MNSFFSRKFTLSFYTHNKSYNIIFHFPKDSYKNNDGGLSSSDLSVKKVSALSSLFQKIQNFQRGAQLSVKIGNTPPLVS